MLPPIPELLRLICENCDQQTLATVALTSRHLYEPAQDVLWHDLGNLGPLIRCMPHDLWRERRCKSWEDANRIELSFCRSIKETDWVRFRANARRVRRFGFKRDLIQAEARFLLATDVYHFFHRAGVTTSLLPNVRALAWPCYRQVEADSVFPYIDLFLSPSVKELDVAVLSWDAKRCQSRVSLLHSLVSLCPDVVSFHLNHVTDHTMKQTRPAQLHHYLTTYPIIEQWQSLQHLHIIGLPRATLFDLPHLVPTLKTLEISFWASKREENREPVHPVQKFTAMDTMILRNCYYDSALQLIKMMGKAPLRSLVLDLTEERCHFSLEEWQSLFRTMQEHLVHDCLEEVCIDCCQHETDDLLVHPLTVESLAPLFPFKNLRKLSIAYCDSFQLDDAAIEIVAAAWVHLEHLEFRAYELSLLPLCTIRGLISIAEHCRALRHLEFAFDATVITEDDIKLMSGVRNESLRVLSVEDSPIQDHSLVAATLSKIVPMVRCIRTPWPHQFGDQPWKEVERLLQIPATARTTD